MPASVKRLKMLSQPFGEDGEEGLPEALEETRTCLDLGNSAQWRLGRVYNYISDRELFKEKGFADTYLLLVHEFGEISRSWLSLCGQIANDYSEAEVKKYKVTLLSRLTAYKEVANEGPTEKGDPGNFKVMVPLADGTTQAKPFSKCSRKDLDKAIARHKSPPLTVPPQDLKLVNRMTVSLQGLLGATTSAAMKATYAGGKTFVNLTHVDIVRFEEVLKALLAAQPDPDVVKTPHASPRRSALRGVKR